MGWGTLGESFLPMMTIMCSGLGESSERSTPVDLVRVAIPKKKQPNRAAESKGKSKFSVVKQSNVIMVQIRFRISRIRKIDCSG